MTTVSHHLADRSSLVLRALSLDFCYCLRCFDPVSPQIFRSLSHILTFRYMYRRLLPKSIPTSGQTINKVRGQCSQGPIQIGDCHILTFTAPSRQARADPGLGMRLIQTNAGTLVFFYL